MDVDSSANDLDDCLCYDWDRQDGKCMGICDLPNYRLVTYRFTDASGPFFGLRTIWDVPPTDPSTGKVPEKEAKETLVAYLNTNFKPK
jgi:hypothetical protein